MKFKDVFPELAFKDECDDDLDISDQNLTSLEGCPKIIRGDFRCGNNSLQSLVGGPERVEGSYYCGRNLLQSLDGIASYIDGHLTFENNPIESIAGIHKKISYLGGRGIWAPSSCKKGVLDIFKINAPNLTYFNCRYFNCKNVNVNVNVNVNDIFKKYIYSIKSGQLTKTQAMLQCQSELIENDLDEYTEY